MSKRDLCRRDFLRLGAAAATGAILAACQPKVVEVEKVVTKEVEKVVTKEVEKIVKETVVVEAPPVPAAEAKFELEHWNGFFAAETALKRRSETMRNRAGNGPLRPIRAHGDGFAVEGPGFYYWDQDLDTVLHVARQLGCDAPELEQSRRLLIPDEGASRVTETRRRSRRAGRGATGTGEPRARRRR